MKKRFHYLLILAAVLIAAVSFPSAAQAGSRDITIIMQPGKRDVTRELKEMVDVLKTWKYRRAKIIFPPGVYNISREKSTPRVQHISNTASAQENPDPTKHYGLYLHGLKNVTISGYGATLLTHGEMTAIAIDSCRNIRIEGLTIDAADPSVAEMTVLHRSDSTLIAIPSPKTRYRIDGSGRLKWTGSGWEFGGGIAQIYNGATTLRTASPMTRYTRVTRLGEGAILFHYNPGRAPEANAGDVYQMRHSIRNEVATFINQSKRVSFKDVNYRYMGNFGMVGQNSRDITLRRVVCAPEAGSGQTCAGFADFVQMSGCRGKIRVIDCTFVGSHDDPINVHGTHLKVVRVDGSTLGVRYMHPQTFGFPPFFAGDRLDLVDPHTLIPAASARVTAVRAVNDYDWEVALDTDLSPTVAALGEAVVENVSANPDVEIRGCRFTLTPTRGILVTTRGKVRITDNLFDRLPMSAILIADDARSWYESGPVRDVVIRNNTFRNCASPVIWVNPENDRNVAPVHRNVRIIGNRFEGDNMQDTECSLLEIIDVRSCDDLVIKANKLPNSTPRILVSDSCAKH